MKPAKPRAVRLRIASETIRLLAGDDLVLLRAGAIPVPVTETCHTPSCPGDYTCDCPY